MAAAVAFLLAYLVGASIHATPSAVLVHPADDSAENEKRCNETDDFCPENEGGSLFYRDCDGDGIRDPFCQGPDLLKFGYLSSKNNCESTWPNGHCSEKSPRDQGMARQNQITIIHLNDVYEVSGVTSGKGADKVRRGGMSRAAYVIQNERTKNPNRTFVMSAGDHLSPSILSSLSNGTHMVDLLNKIGLDAASLGNHEFDFGVGNLKQRVKESKFSWLNVNIKDEKGELFEGTKKYLIKNISFTPPWETKAIQARFCAFGALYDISKKVLKDPVGYLPIMETSLSEATNLRENEKCNVVVALTHQLSQDDCRLSAKLGDKVDLILGGHDHNTEYHTECGHAPYAKADSDLKTLWVMKLFLGPTGKVQSMEAKLMTLTDADPFDVDIHKEVLRLENDARGKMEEKIGCLKGALDAHESALKKGETAIGNWYADTIRASQHTDVGVFHGGGVKGDCVYEKGMLNMKILIKMNPRGSTIVNVRATGAQLKSYINEALNCYEKECGSFVHISGLNYTFNTNMEHGERLRKLVRPSGDEVGENDKLTVAMPDYVYYTKGGFAHNELYDMTTVNDAVPLVDLLAEDVKAAGATCINPKEDGRIKDETKKN